MRGPQPGGQYKSVRTRGCGLRILPLSVARRPRGPASPAGSGRRPGTSGAVALLELLTRAARAQVVPPHLVVLRRDALPRRLEGVDGAAADIAAERAGDHRGALLRLVLVREPAVAGGRRL